jgi:hypothetical protein
MRVLRSRRIYATEKSPRSDIALQRNRANSEAMSAAQPRGHAMAQAFVQNILEHTGERRDSHHREPIIFGR